jgi:hypothetical protein
MCAIEQSGRVIYGRKESINTLKLRHGKVRIECFFAQHVTTDDAWH